MVSRPASYQLRGRQGMSSRNWCRLSQLCPCAGPEYGYKNLAVFFQACNFNCLYCQNWRFKTETFHPRRESVTILVSSVDNKTSCICYFGGDPTPQLPFALKASRLALEMNEGKILRICWETNGSMNESLLDRMLDLALRSGGSIIRPQSLG